MSRNKYSFATFSNKSLKRPLTELSGSALGILERIYDMFRTYAADSQGQSSRWILHNMMRNSESIFSLGILDINYGAGTSSEGQSSQESSSPSEEDSSSSCSTHASENSETETIEAGENAGSNSKDIKFLIRKNLVQIKSMSVNRQGDSVEVEIDFDPPCISEVISPEPGASPSKETNSPGTSVQKSSNPGTSVQKSSSPGTSIQKISSPGTSVHKSSSPGKSVHKSSSPGTSVQKSSSPGTSVQKSSSPGTDRKRKSSSVSPSKRKKETDSRSPTSKSHQTIDYSDPNIMGFLSRRLSSILSWRKTCMDQIYNCYEIFESDVKLFRSTVVNIKFVVRYLPMKNESYLNDDLVKLRDDLIKNCEYMLEKIKPLVDDVQEDKEALSDCKISIENFEKEHASSLSTDSESIPTYDKIKNLELDLKKICKSADEKVILEGERRAILVNSSSDFRWLVNNFVKFLIITELLKPNMTDSSQSGTET